MRGAAGSRKNCLRRVRHARRAVPARVLRGKGFYFQATRCGPGEAHERRASSGTPLAAQSDEVNHWLRGRGRGRGQPFEPYKY